MGDVNMGKAFTRHAEAWPDRPAITDGTRTFTYQEVENAATRLAVALRALEFQTGQSVGIRLPNSPEHVIAYLAVGKAGMESVVLSNDLPRSAFLDALLQQRPDGYLSTKRLAGDFPADVPGLLLDEHRWESLPQTAIEPGDAPTGITFFTSGSTSVPKPIRLPGESVCRSAVAVRNLLSVNRDSRAIVFNVTRPASLNWAVWPVLMAGGCVHIASAASPERFWDQFSTWQPTIVIAAPYVVEALLASAPSHTLNPALKWWLVGGDQLGPRSLSQLQAVIHHPVSAAYGLTEAGPCAFAKLAGGNTIGSPIAGVEVRIEDADGLGVAEGQIGELLVRSPWTMAGCRPGPRSESPHAEDWIRTGDLVSRRPGSELIFEGRIKDVVSLGGAKVSPGRLIEAMLAHPEVIDCAIGSQPTEDGDVPICFVVAPQATEDELSDWLGERMAPIEFAWHVRRMDELPRLANGKIDRAALRGASLGIPQSKTL